MRYKGILSTFFIVFGICFASYVYAEEMQPFSIQLNEPKSDVTYAVYQDEQCLEPLLDENEQPMILMPDENGKISYHAEAPFYVKQYKAPDGYYYDDTVYENHKQYSVTLKPISIQIHSNVMEKHVTYSLIDTEDDTVVWERYTDVSEFAITSEDSFKLKCDHDYQLKCVPDDSYVLTLLLSVHVPNHSDMDHIVHCTFQSFGKVMINTINEDKESIAPVSYTIYEDEQLTSTAHDIEGNEVIFENCRAQMNVRLKEGTYYVVQNEILDTYYIETKPKKITIADHKDTYVTFENQPVMYMFQIENIVHEQLSGTLVLDDGITPVDINSNDKISLRRNTTYTVSYPNELPMYFPCTDLSFQTGSEPQDTQMITMYMHRFEVNIHIEDSAGHNVPNGLFAIYDEKNQMVEQFSSEHLYSCQNLMPSHTYRIQCITAPVGYVKPDDLYFEIQANSTSDVSIPIVIPMYRYTIVNMKAIDESTQETLSAYTYDVFVEESCITIAKDVYGTLCTDVQNVTLEEGVYYLRPHKMDHHYFRNDTVEMITIGPNSNYSETVVWPFQRIDISIHVNNMGEMISPNCVIEILDDQKKSLGQYEVQGDIHLSETNLSDYLLSEHVYYVHLLRVDGLFTYDKSFQKIEIPSSYNGQLEMEFILNPYFNLTVEQLNGEIPILGNEITLYRDASCTIVAKDIYLNDMKDQTNQDGSIHWLLRKGKYYLKQTYTQPQFYVNDAIVEIEINDNETVRLSLSRPVLKIESIDEYQSLLKGGLYELYDSHHQLLYTWDSASITFEEDWLLPGSTYYVKEVQSPDQYKKINVEIPIQISETVQAQPNIVYLKHQRKDSHIEMSSHMTSTNQNHVLRVTFIVMGVGLMLSVIMMKIFSKNEKNREK